MSVEKVTVWIAGEEYSIRSNAEAEYTKKCADLVNERILEIRSKAGLIEGHKAAILAALQIADEYFQALEETERIRNDVVTRAANLRQKVEAHLAASAPGMTERQG